MPWKYIIIDSHERFGKNNILELAAKFNPAVIWVDRVRYDRPKKKYFDKDKNNG
jgi:hypothetical protein